MATKIERERIGELFEAVTKDYGTDGEFEMHPKQEQGSYSDGVADVLDMLQWGLTVEEILKE